MISSCSALIISEASTEAKFLAKSALTLSRSSPAPSLFKYPFNCSVRLSGFVSSPALFSLAAFASSSSLTAPSASTIAPAGFADSFLPAIAGISPTSSKPLDIRAETISIIEMPFILAPFGMVVILPTEFNIAFLVISVKPSPYIISVNSGYSLTSSYTVLFKSIFFDIVSSSSSLLYYKDNARYNKIMLF